MAAWPDGAPASARRQVERTVDGARTAFGDALANVTLHGSLAMGCFNPAMSDVDLLVVVWRAPAPAELTAFARAALDVSGNPHELELTLVRAADLEPFTHPTPSQLHVAEHLRDELERRIDLGGWTEERVLDPDTAAHVVMGIARGVCLAGDPLGELTSGVPVADFVDSLAADLAWLSERLDAAPSHGVLNCCRLLHFVLEGVLSSKVEGAVWAAGVAPEALDPVIAAALAHYRGDSGRPPAVGAARAVVEWASGIFERVRAVRGW